MPQRHPALTAAFALSLAAAHALPAQGQTLLSGDHSIDGRLCVGNACTAPETLTNMTMKLKQASLALVFQDSSSSPYSTNDWRILANEAASYGIESFSVEDDETGNQIFRLMAGAPMSALTVAASGDVGMGTISPQAELHIVDGTWPRIRLEQDGSEGQTPGIWDIGMITSDFYVAQVEPQPNGTPFSIERDAPSFSLRIRHDGSVGFGTNNPTAPIHIWRDDGNARLRVQEVGSNTGPQTLINLENNGRPEIVLANTSTGSEWSFGAGTNFVLKQGAYHTESSAKTKLFEIDPAGNATLTGSLTTGGTTCGGGCDAVFAPGYSLPSIAEHAARMQALGYLPNVGPTPEGAPFNVTDKLGRMLNELEHAHLYIAQLSRENAAQQLLNARLEARLAWIEAHLSD